MYVHIPYCRRRCNYCDFAIVPVGEGRKTGGDDDGGGVSEPDPLAALARAFALMADDGEDEMGNAPAKPGTFGAMVWTRAISGRLAEMERITNDLLNERLRLNPTTIADLPLFARDGDPVDADDCDPHGPGVQCHACAAEE